MNLAKRQIKTPNRQIKNPRDAAKPQWFFFFWLTNEQNIENVSEFGYQHTNQNTN